MHPVTLVLLCVFGPSLPVAMAWALWTGLGYDASGFSTPVQAIWVGLLWWLFLPIAVGDAIARRNPKIVSNAAHSGARRPFSDLL